MNFNITLLPGDGIGPEVTAAARLTLDAVSARFGHSFAYEEKLFGGAAIDGAGDPLPADTLESAKKADAVFLGAVGGPKWDDAPRRPEAGLLGLRKALGLFANLRPVSVHPATAKLSPLKPEIVEGADLLIVRELTGGLYFGEKKRDAERASDNCVYTRPEIERIARVAFEAARKRRGKVTSIDKANVLETSRLWREVVIDIHGKEFPDVELDHGLVDAAAMHLIRRPSDYDVIVTENMFGDILSDEASMLAGSIGLLGSASLGGDGPGLFEPIHGSAPDIAGESKANPIGAISSSAMMLRFGLNLNEEADAVEAAISAALDAGETTADLGGDLSTTQVGENIAKRVAG